MFGIVDSFYHKGLVSTEAGQAHFCIKRELMKHLDAEVFAGEEVGMQWRLVFSDLVSGSKREIPAFGTVPEAEEN